MINVKNSFSSFSVTNIEKAREFYGKTLGLLVKDGIMGLLEIHLPNNSPIIIYPKKDHSPAVFTVLNFKVDDIENTVYRLTKAGVEMERYEGFEMDPRGISRGPGPAIAWFKDPFGNILSVLED